MAAPFYTGLTTQGQEAANYSAQVSGNHEMSESDNLRAQANRAGYNYSGYGNPAPQGAGGGAGGFGGALAGSYANAFGQAQAANLQRYGQILGVGGQSQYDKDVAQWGVGHANAARAAAGGGGAPAGPSSADPSGGGYAGRYQRGMAGIASLGTYDRARLNAQFDRAGAAQQQGLVGGAYNSTVRANMMQGNERERANATLGLNESLRRNYQQADASLSGDTLGFMERRNDNYPDLNQLVGLNQAYGAAGGGGFGGGGGGFRGIGFSGGGYQIPGGYGGGMGYEGLSSGYGAGSDFYGSLPTRGGITTGVTGQQTPTAGGGFGGMAGPGGFSGFSGGPSSFSSTYGDTGMPAWGFSGLGAGFAPTGEAYPLTPAASGGTAAGWPNGGETYSPAPGSSYGGFTPSQPGAGGPLPQALLDEFSARQQAAGAWKPGTF